MKRRAFLCQQLETFFHRNSFRSLWEIHNETLKLRIVIGVEHVSSLSHLPELMDGVGEFHFNGFFELFKPASCECRSFQCGAESCSLGYQLIIEMITGKSLASSSIPFQFSTNPCGIKHRPELGFILVRNQLF